MDVYEAYNRLGLTPLDDYLDETGRGSTTWMLVEAILHSKNRGEVVILCSHTIQEAYKLAMKAATLAAQLGITCRGEVKKNQFVELDSGKVYYSSYNTVKNLDIEGREFWAAKWKDMAIRRTKGPYERIRKLVYNAVSKGFDARDERDDFILSMTIEGADRHLLDNMTNTELVDPENILGWR
jgi:hypothetical protein